MVANISFLRLSVFDHCESVAEELKMNGFDVRVINGMNGCGWLIEYDTIAGRMKYSCSEKVVMSDYYRFISHYGGRLSKWGLDNKLETYNDKYSTTM
jgi:hypothetical protein